jgi:hypothetical protein
MTGDTIECFNCGHANPSWAQVCRSCGYPIQASGPLSGAPAGIFPTDQASLISIGGTLGAIVLAIALGLFFSGLIPPAPNVAEETPSPSPTPSAQASSSAAPSGSGSVGPTVAPTPALLGTITFGTGLNTDTKQVTNPTTTFSAGVAFAHSIKLTQAFGVNKIQEEVVKVGGDGTQTVVQKRAGSDLTVNAVSKIAGFRVKDAGTLVSAWGAGNFILRVYRNSTELLAEGPFTLK